MDSVLTQTFTDFELIAINDGSTDHSSNILSVYANQDARVKIINQENAGSPTARNTGIAHAQSDFVALMDSDDISHPQRLEKQFAFLSENPDYAAVSCRCELIDEYGVSIKVQRPRNSSQESELPLEQLLRGPLSINQTAMIRLTSLAGSNEIFRPWFKVLEDFEFSLRIAEKHRVAHLNDNPPLYQYRQYRGQSANLMSQDPVLFWYYWCAAALSAYHRRNGTDDPIIEAAQDGWEPQDVMPRLFELPHEIKAPCIRSASHWCKRLLRQGMSDRVGHFTDWILIIADNPDDARVAKKTLRKILFYLIFSWQWKAAARVVDQIYGDRLNDK